MSAVPKVAMAQSLTPGGRVSITADPTALTGDTEGLSAAAVSSPQMTPMPTASIPATALHARRRLMRAPSQFPAP